MAPKFFDIPYIDLCDIWSIDYSGNDTASFWA